MKKENTDKKLKKSIKFSNKNKNDENNLNILEEYYNIETIEQNECLEDGSFIEIDIDKIENELN